MLPGSRMIRPEDDDERMPLLRQRLMVSGELSRRSSGGGYGFGYGDDLEPAVRRYQFNNGLRVTGRVDKPTLLALNVPAQARLAQLRVNLQRLRDLTAQRIEDRYVLVNVPPSSSRRWSATRWSTAIASSPASPSARRRPCAPPSRRSTSSPIGGCPRASPTST